MSSWHHFKVGRRKLAVGFGLFPYMNTKSVTRRQDYIALPEGGRLVAVIAALQADNHSGPPWAFWHSNLGLDEYR